jgi:hypothetical protein
MGWTASFSSVSALIKSLQCLTAWKYEHVWTAAVDHGKLDLSIKRRGVNGQPHGRPL